VLAALAPKLEVRASAGHVGDVHKVRPRIVALRRDGPRRPRDVLDALVLRQNQALFLSSVHGINMDIKRPTSSIDFRARKWDLYVHDTKDQGGRSS